MYLTGNILQCPKTGGALICLNDEEYAPPGELRFVDWVAQKGVSEKQCFTTSGDEIVLCMVLGSIEDAPGLDRLATISCFSEGDTEAFYCDIFCLDSKNVHGTFRLIRSPWPSSRGSYFVKCTKFNYFRTRFVCAVCGDNIWEGCDHNCNLSNIILSPECIHAHCSLGLIPAHVPSDAFLFPVARPSRTFQNYDGVPLGSSLCCHGTGGRPGRLTGSKRPVSS